VCGVALALEVLGVDRVACSPLPIGRGLIKAAHGVLPLPAPATLELLRGVPLHGVDADVELVTPTGAALVAALAEDRFGPLPPLALEAVGYGAGARDLPERPKWSACCSAPLSWTRRPAVAGPPCSWSARSTTSRASSWPTPRPRASRPGRSTPGSPPSR
jgi:hypothetical protein